jgi:hypothetical protein
MVTRRSFVATATAMGISLAAPATAAAQSDAGTPLAGEGGDMADMAVQTGYAR